MSLAVTTDTVESGERRFQLLALSVRIATDCPILDRKLEYLVQDARQDYPMTDEIRLEAQRHADGYRICEAGREPRAQVHGRAGRPCPRCTAAIRSWGQGEANRTAYWCPACQQGGPPVAAL